MFKYAALLAFVSLVPSVVNAQAQLYGQCGGIGWTVGATFLQLQFSYSHSDISQGRHILR
jgi:hypothetical protein